MALRLSISRPASNAHRFAGGLEGHTIQFGSGKAVSLEDGGSVGTGMIGHAYDVMRGGNCSLFPFRPIEGRVTPQGLISGLWPQGRPARRGEYLYGECRVRVRRPRG